MEKINDEIFRLSYALNKHVPSSYLQSIVSSYGEFELDEEMKLAVENALTDIVKIRLAEMKQRKDILNFLDRSGIVPNPWEVLQDKTTDELIALTRERTAELIADLSKRIGELENEREGT